MNPTEAADKAWEAAIKRNREDRNVIAEAHKVHPNKETFMKELFKPVTIWKN